MQIIKASTDEQKNYFLRLINQCNEGIFYPSHLVAYMQNIKNRDYWILRRSLDSASIVNGSAERNSILLSEMLSSGMVELEDLTDEGMIEKGYFI